MLQVCANLSRMAEAGREKLAGHATEHLPGGAFHEPPESAIRAGALLGTATNDTVESGFGMLDWQQTICPVCKPLNTSAIVVAKRDKPVDYIMKQPVDLKVSSYNEYLMFNFNR